MVDAVHVWNLLMRLRMACAPDQEAAPGEEDADEEAKLQGGSGRSSNDINVGGAAVPAQPQKSKRGLFLDVFVILPVMQVRAWVVQEWSQLSIPQFAFFVLFQMFHLFVR
jgi:hypothetical protein